MATWLMRPHAAERTQRGWYSGYLAKVLRFPVLLVAVYLVVALGAIAFMYPRVGTEVFPTTDSGQFQLRLRAPTGTRIERTEVAALSAMDLIRRTVGAEQVAITTSFIGVQPSSYPVNTIYLWTSGPHEAVLLVALKPGGNLRGEDLKEELRRRFAREMPDVKISFEAGDIVSRVMSFGSDTTVEVAVQGPSITVNRAHAAKLHAELSKLTHLRDLQYAQPFDYPTLEINVDRERAGQYGLTAAGVARSLVAATSSSRFIEPGYWRDPNSGNAFQVQVEIPQNRMSSMEDVRSIPVTTGGTALLSDVADLTLGTAPGLVERYNMQRVVSLTANIHGQALGDVADDIREAIRKAGEPPRGTTVAVRGQIPPLEETIAGLEIGLALAVAAIFLVLAANFQSFRLAIAVLLTIPAALVGVLLMLKMTGTTLNVQSFMGAIMAIGIAVANSILLVTFAEFRRREGADSFVAAVEGANGRLRAICMTAVAMIAGMVPIALGIGEGTEQTAPLARAVIGGLIFSTVGTLTVLPAVYAIVQKKARTVTASLHPLDPNGSFYDPK
jgi:multidrug efflux pump subunit AcrB